ncbi:tyrosine-protein phosphatase [Gemmobacter sp.]|uniref:tyrosine-protein phosphatase n=1 Tax=Gemmobacter sp. TaxID=1898957 RepID=UPI002AFF7C2C|nr:tyrosine-protein phosphatase [Gemmobacter sp.]
MLTDHPRLLSVPGVLNLRDLGGYRTRRGYQTRWRSLYRGAGLHTMRPEGDAVLRDAGLRSVIDLRSHHEALEEPNPLAIAPGVAYHPIPLFDDLAPTIKQVKARNSDDLLLDLYMEALNAQSGAVRAVLATIAAAPEGAVLFHCTAGKDRTGIIAALLLGAADVERDDIVADYAQTGANIVPLVERLLARTRANGGDPVTHARFLRCEAPTMEAMLDHIERRHGSISGYLADIGLTVSDIEALRDRLLAGA